MSDISNRTIVALLAVALVVSVAGTMYSVSELGSMNGIIIKSIHGASTNDEGNITIDVSPTVGIIVHHEFANLGSGGLASGASNCTFSTGGSPTNADAVTEAGAVHGLNKTGVEFYGIDTMNDDNGGCTGNFTQAGTSLSNNAGSPHGREQGFHLIENIGNVNVRVDAVWDQIRLLPNNVVDKNVCNFLTGIDDSNNDGTDGCFNSGSQEQTPPDQPVVVALFPSTAHNQISPEPDKIVTLNDVNDTAHSLKVETGNEKRYYINLSGSSYEGGSATPQEFIQALTFQEIQDEAVVNFVFRIPQGAKPGAREARILYTASEQPNSLSG